MKTILLSIALFVMTGLTTTFAQSAQYQAAMTDALADLKATSATTKADEWLSIAGQFERIAGAEPTQWLPGYYTALVYNLLGFSGSDAATKDKFLDKAGQWAAGADKISPDNDEVHVLLAQIAQARMVVDPMSRWQEYGPVAGREIETAMKLNPANPRPYVLQGSSLMYTPEQFGGGPKTACPVLKQAAEKFATFKPASSLHPSWGQAQIEPMLAKCK
jgi:hypothetical protein